MNIAAKIQPFARVIPMIYAYNHPDYPPHNGWVKIGYTDRQTVEQRVKQQHHTSDVAYKILWRDNAMYKDGSGDYFDDHDFHAYLTRQRHVERKADTEWFKISGGDARAMFDEFASRELPLTNVGSEYTLRAEQAKAVHDTKEYFEAGGTEYLWNAKPRFGKTLAAYDLVRQMGFAKVLIVTNRPSIANSWADDFNKFIGWRGELCFVSDTDALTGKEGVLGREEYLAAMRTAEEPKGMVAFESLQGLKGSVYFGGDYNKLRWMAKEYKDEYGKKQHGVEFDLLIVDEAQEGVDTMRTERAFRNIQRKYTLYLSGTPFKALASEQFSAGQIFNWSYADEQAAKDNWQGENSNPYENLPRLAMFTYQLSNMIYDRISGGMLLPDSDESIDYAFDLNEFFATNESGRFIHDSDVRRFLHSLTTQEKYPFSTPQLRSELAHTLWLLDRVASAKALAKLLHDDEFADIFGDYEIVLAAGDGRLSDGEDAAEHAFERVNNAIADHEKTITLSVGQLTVGVTIPQWSGVLMLCNMQSPSSYMQAAFRAQNPCSFIKNGQLYRKQTAYVFDFDPARTLIIFDEFANNLRADTAAGKGTSDDRRKNIDYLLNFFPVLSEDKEGKMVELDAAAVLSIPRQLKSQAVVRSGFMSNFLFQNIGNIFGAPSVVKEILEKITPAKEETKKRDEAPLDNIADVQVDDEGEVIVPNEIVIGKTQDLFGPKVYEQAVQQITPQVDAIAQSGSEAKVEQNIKAVADTVKEKIKQYFVAPIMTDYGAKKSTQDRVARQVEREIDRKFEELHADYKQQANIAKVEFERRQQEADTPQQIKQAENDYKATLDSAMQTLVSSMQESVQKTIEEKPKEIVEQMERYKAEEEKKSVEDTVRGHLRGFSRTIPSFLMAYGSEEVTLENFDEIIPDNVFQEVTSISLAQFRFLRDGGDYADPDTGEQKHFNGNLFDAVVFDDSVKEFMRLRRRLANYFDEEQKEDIFDYIPPQKTNQIFTPKWVVKKMVDLLEQENPGCFDDPSKTFIDLYMKSGLYIAEIVKRLYRSEGLKRSYPDSTERLRHIFAKQVYGLAPTEIIYRIATNFVLGFDENGSTYINNLKQLDALPYTKEGTLEKKLDEVFG